MLRSSLAALPSEHGSLNLHSDLAPRLLSGKNSGFLNPPITNILDLYRQPNFVTLVQEVIMTLGHFCILPKFHWHCDSVCELTVL